MPAQTAERRTQEERSASTIQAIDNATIRCLIEDGFTGTTTTAVTSRAGVSRGALTHQFASKQEMMLSAVRHLSEVRQAELAELADNMPTDRNRTKAVIEALWATFKSDLFYASLELWTAARTNPELLEGLQAVERELGAQHKALAAQMFGEKVAARPNFESAVDLLFRTLRGAALTRIVRRDPASEDKAIDDWVAIFDRSASS